MYIYINGLIYVSIYKTICKLLLSIYRRSFFNVERKREKTFRFYNNLKVDG